MFTEIASIPRKPVLHTHRTNWSSFRRTIEDTIELEIPLKTAEDLEQALADFTELIQGAAWDSTPSSEETNPHINCPSVIREKIKEKQKLRRRWQTTRHPDDKKTFNKATEELKYLLNDIRDKSIEDYLEERSLKYKDRLCAHPNPTIESDILIPVVSRRLQRRWPCDLYDDAQRGGGECLT
ncbi:hypothetical protein DMENIID0001_050370 [Sergentomyia squamirostris]